MNKLQRVKEEVKYKSFIWVVPTKVVNRVLDKNFAKRSNTSWRYFVVTIKWKNYWFSKSKIKRLPEFLDYLWINNYSIDNTKTYCSNWIKYKTDFIF